MRVEWFEKLRQSLIEVNDSAETDDEMFLMYIIIKTIEENTEAEYEEDNDEVN